MRCTDFCNYLKYVCNSYFAHYVLFCGYFILTDIGYKYLFYLNAHVNDCDLIMLNSLILHYTSQKKPRHLR